MSGTTVRITVRPGQRVAAALAARRGELLERRRIEVQQALSARNVGTRSARQAPSAIDILEARGRTVRVSTPAVREIDRAIARAWSQPSHRAVDIAERVVGKAERAEEQRELARARQEEEMVDLLTHLPEGLVTSGEVSRAPDGTLVTRLGIDAAGEVELALDPRGHVDLDMAEAGIDELSTPAGTVAGCDATRALAQRIYETWRQAGIDADVPVEEDNAERTHVRSQEVAK